MLESIDFVLPVFCINTALVFNLEASFKRQTFNLSLESPAIIQLSRQSNISYRNIKNKEFSLFIELCDSAGQRRYHSVVESDH